MGTLLGLLCEAVCGHRLGPWVRLIVPGCPRARFERAQCRWCRQGYVRPMPLGRWRGGQADHTG